MPKSGDEELQMAPMLAAASMASTAYTLLGKYPVIGHREKDLGSGYVACGGIPKGP